MSAKVPSGPPKRIKAEAPPPVAVKGQVNAQNIGTGFRPSEALGTEGHDRRDQGKEEKRPGYVAGPALKGNATEKPKQPPPTPRRYDPPPPPPPRPPPPRRKASPPPQPRGLPGPFDYHDRAPEDRYQPCMPAVREFSDYFSPHDAVVRGSLHIEGVNYAKYEAVKDRPEIVAAFLDALRDDLISEVGNGVRREDILLQVFPGAIKTVVLHYDSGSPRRGSPDDPKLVDAEWSVKVDYAIRARDIQRQQNIAIALYTALTAEGGFSTHKTKKVYVERLDQSHGDMSKIMVTRPADASESGRQQQQQQQPQQRQSLVSPPRQSQAIGGPGYGAPPLRTRATVTPAYAAPAPLQIPPSPHTGGHPYSYMQEPSQLPYASHPPPSSPVPPPASPSHIPNYQLSTMPLANRYESNPPPVPPSMQPDRDVYRGYVSAAHHTTAGRTSPPPPFVPTPSHQNTSSPQLTSRYEVFTRDEPIRERSDRSEKPTLLPPGTTASADGWAEVNGQKGLAVFIPEEALVAASGGTPRRKSSKRRSEKRRSHMSGAPTPSLPSYITPAKSEGY